MKNLLFCFLIMPLSIFSQTNVDSIYIFDIGDEFHFEIMDSNTLIQKSEKRIVIGKTPFGNVYQYQFQVYGRTKYPNIVPLHSYDFIRTTSYPGLGMITTDTVAPCTSSSHVYYNATFSNPNLGIYNCKFTDTIVTRNDYGPTNNRSYFSSNTYSIEDYFSTGLGRSLRVETFRDSISSYNVTEKLVYYKKDSINKTWGTPWTFTSSISEIPTLDFSVYPNPASDFIRINVLDDSKMTYTLFNSIGKLVVSGSLTSNQLDCSNLQNGIYFLKITNNNGNSGVKRIVVSR